MMRCSKRSLRCHRLPTPTTITPLCIVIGRKGTGSVLHPGKWSRLRRLVSTTQSSCRRCVNLARFWKRLSGHNQCKSHCRIWKTTAGLTGTRNLSMSLSSLWISIIIAVTASRGMLTLKCTWRLSSVSSKRIHTWTNHSRSFTHIAIIETNRYRNTVSVRTFRESRMRRLELRSTKWRNKITIRIVRRATSAIWWESDSPAPCGTATSRNTRGMSWTTSRSLQSRLRGSTSPDNGYVMNLF